jgi:gliding motility-associated-like protein
MTENTLDISRMVDFSCGIYKLFTTITVIKCDTVSDTLVVIMEDCHLFVPNVFSPNGDGKNDKFYPLSKCEFEQYQFLVFNRLGGVVFKTSDPLEKRDGKFKGSDCSTGAYTYLLFYKFPTEKSEKVHGSVTLVR